MKNTRFVLLAGLLLMAGACGSDDEAGPATTTIAASTSSAAPTTVVVTTGSESPTSAAPTIPPATTTTSIVTTTSPACDIGGGVEPVVVDFPMKMSSLVGRDIRTGRQECFERVVIEFAGSGELPGYRVQYVPEDEVTDSPRGEPVAVAGAATLVISAASWMPDMEGAGYAGPLQFTPDNVVAIQELVQLENFEGMFQWAVGLDEQRAFTVTTYEDPIRLVVDIATS